MQIGCFIIGLKFIITRKAAALHRLYLWNKVAKLEICCCSVIVTALMLISISILIMQTFYQSHISTIAAASEGLEVARWVSEKSYYFEGRPKLFHILDARRLSLRHYYGVELTSTF